MRSMIPRSCSTTRVRARSSRAEPSRAAGSVITTSRRSGDTRRASGPIRLKSTVASTSPDATMTIRSPLMKDGTFFASFSTSTTCWRFARAA